MKGPSIREMNGREHGSRKFIKKIVKCTMLDEKSSDMLGLIAEGSGKLHPRNAGLSDERRIEAFAVSGRKSLE